MPDIESYENLLAEEYADDVHVRLDSHGGVAVRGAGGNVAAFLTRSAGTQNAEVMVDFKVALTKAYGQEAAAKAFTDAGLEQKEETGGTLTVHRMRDAMAGARNDLVIRQDQAYKAQYEQRNMAAQGWVVPTTASALTEQDFPGLRMHKMETSDMRVQAWHPSNCERYDRFELDNAIRAEQAGLQALEGNPRLQNLQARLNLLETMVARAETEIQNYPEPGKMEVFTAPEWLFTAMEGTDPQGNPISGGTLTEGEMKQVTEKLVAMSARHPNVTIMAGTMLWSKPAEDLLDIKGENTPADMVFNMAPVVANGQLVHMAGKILDGTDVILAAKGNANETPYEIAGHQNGCASRLQVFRHDPGNKQSNEAGVIDLQREMKDMMEPNSNFRAWEATHRHGAPAPSANLLFQHQQKTIAMDICADHGDNAALKEFKALRTREPNHPLVQAIEATEGTDGHLVIAAGIELKSVACMAKQGGAFAVTELMDGKLESKPVTNAFRVDPDGEVRRTTGAKATRARIPSNVAPANVGNAAGIHAPAVGAPGHQVAHGVNAV